MGTSYMCLSSSNSELTTLIASIVSRASFSSLLYRTSSSSLTLLGKLGCIRDRLLFHEVDRVSTWSLFNIWTETSPQNQLSLLHFFKNKVVSIWTYGNLDLPSFLHLKIWFENKNWKINLSLVSEHPQHVIAKTTNIIYMSSLG